MPDGFFKNLFGKKEDEDTPPEERLIPNSAKNLSPGTEWVTSQVFAYGKKDRQRLYFSFSFSPDSVSNLNIYQWIYEVDSKGGNGKGLKPVLVDYAGSLQEAMLILAREEKKLLDPASKLKAKPVAHLKGNYRQVAPRHGFLVDESGNCVTVDVEKPLLANAVMNRKAIEALYTPKADSGVPVIASWDDFYREIVNKTPLENPEQIAADPGYANFALSARASLGKGKKLHQIFADVSKPPHQKGFYDVPWNYSWEKAPAAAYAYNVAVVTSVLRAAGALYAQMPKAEPADMRAIVNILKDADGFVRNFAQKYMGFSKETAAQISKVMLLGPDPYADRSLPLEELLDKYPVSAVTVSKKKTSFPPSNGPSGSYH